LPHHLFESLQTTEIPHGLSIHQREADIHRHADGYGPLPGLRRARLIPHPPPGGFSPSFSGATARSLIESAASNYRPILQNWQEKTCPSAAVSNPHRCPGHHFDLLTITPGSGENRFESGGDENEGGGLDGPHGGGFPRGGWTYPEAAGVLSPKTKISKGQPSRMEKRPPHPSAERIWGDDGMGAEFGNAPCSGMHGSHPDRWDIEKSKRG
jgi:hypothetical protein